MRVFGAWLKEIARVQGNHRSQFGSSNDKAKPTFNRDKPKTTSIVATSDSGSSTKTQCPLKDGEHKIWQCEKFRKMQLAQRLEAVRKCNLFLMPWLWTQDWTLYSQPNLWQRWMQQVS